MFFLCFSLITFSFVSYRIYSNTNCLYEVYFSMITFRYYISVLQSRFDILKIHSRKMNLMRGIDLKKIAEKMNGASGAELKVR